MIELNLMTTSEKLMYLFKTNVIVADIVFLILSIILVKRLVTRLKLYKKYKYSPDYKKRRSIIIKCIMHSLFIFISLSGSIFLTTIIVTMEVFIVHDFEMEVVGYSTNKQGITEIILEIDDEKYKYLVNESVYVSNTPPITVEKVEYLIDNSQPLTLSDIKTDRDETFVLKKLGNDRIITRK